MSVTTQSVNSKKSHKLWRIEAKKIRRKRIRQKLAKERDLRNAEEDALLKSDQTYQTWLSEQESFERCQRECEEREHDEQEEMWMRRELLAQKRFREEKKRSDALEKVKEKERLRILEEFENQQKLIQQRIAEKKRLAEEKKRRHELLLQKIEEYVNGDCSELPEELHQLAETNPGKPMCPFFLKTASCRFGDKCNRNHSRPGISRQLLFPHFFSHIRIEQPGNTEYGSDLALEFSETELYRDYDVFFEDVTGELAKYGKMINFQTCKNCEPHLRGNVYVEYGEDRDALRAYRQLQGRYYAGRRINVEFCKLVSWKAAICGLSISRKCPKGGSCNFLHVFKNPGNMYNSRDGLAQNSSRRASVTDCVKSNTSWNDEGTTSTDRRNWRWSESPEAEASFSKRRIRSRSRSRNGKNSSSRSRSRSMSSRSGSQRSRPKSRRSSHSRTKSPLRSNRKNKRSRSKSQSSRTALRDNQLQGKDRKNNRQSRSKSKERKKRKRRKRSKSRTRKSQKTNK